MTSLALTAKGQLTLKRDLLQHMGVEPGQRLELEKLPAGEPAHQGCQTEWLDQRLYWPVCGAGKKTDQH